VQQTLFKNAQAFLHAKYPEWTAAQLLAETRILVADPRATVPPHTTGGAVDVEVLNTATGRLVPMGAPANTEGERGHTYSQAITAAEQQNRLTLLRTMLEAGFANYAYEWWHFSYGDAIWALFYGQPAAHYSMITPNTL
jgi:D-alanyl-D-alanine dipeptidase